MKLLYSILIAFLLALFLNNQAYAQANVSVAFVLDESGSIEDDDFILETQGFINSLGRLPADGRIEISIVGFSKFSEKIAERILLTATGYTALVDSLQNNRQARDNTNMSDAIDTASSLLLSSTAPSKIICLATDGVPYIKRGNDVATNVELAKADTTIAANNAKNAGIIVTPIGVGLINDEFDGKFFLDSIASNPPVPNPVDFNEFSTVVQNVCVGVVQSALNLELTPDPVDFGVLGPQTAVVDICEYTETVGIMNHSDKPAQITNISINGLDKEQFQLMTIAGENAETIQFPFTIPPLSSSTPIEVKLSPTTQSPADGSYDATLTVAAMDENGTDDVISTTLVAKYDPEIAGCLNVIDASPTITKITDNGIPLNGIGNQIQELDIEQALQNKSLARSGLVADGNARLFLAVKTNQVSGTIRFTIEPLNQLTETRLYPLDNTPTYGASGDYDLTGKTTLDVQVTTDSLGIGQATAILRAGERFRGAETVPEVKFKITACLLDGNNCGKFYSSATLRERRAPVVLIHGLWANGNSRGTFRATQEEVEEGKHGLWNVLRQNGYNYVGGHDYPNWLGPHETMQPNQASLSYRINQLCSQAINNDSLACTRADLIGHSMGGLVARKYIHDNRFHKTEKNYMQGSVRRLLTLGTPHFGSGLGNLLTRDDGLLGSCIRRERLVVDDDAILNVDDNGDVQVTIIRTIAEGETLTEEEEEQDFEILENGFWYIDHVREDLNTGQADLEDYNIPGGSLIPAFNIGVHRVAGAIDYLVVGNSMLNALNSEPQNIRTSGFIGNIGGTELAFGGAVFARAIPYTGCSVAEIFQNQDADGIVPVDSARGRLGSATTEVPGVKHLGMGKREGREVVDWVLERLQMELDRFSETASYTKPQSVQIAESKQEENTPMFKNIMQSMKAGFLTLLGITSAYAADTASLQLSVSDVAPAPGSQITFELTSSGDNISVATLTSQKSNLNDHSAPFIWTIDIPNSSAGKYWYYATAFVDNQIVRSNSIVIEVIPSSTLKDMVFEPGFRLVLFPGGEEQLSVIGRYSDGFNREITPSGMGTTYTEKRVSGVTTTSGDSPVFSVSTEGLITARQPGEAEVVATNSGVSVSRRILVALASETDADGDGLSDVEEDNLGTNKYHPDSDNDGVWDNQENLSQPEPQSSSSSGGGCALNQNADFDPILLILMILSIGYLVSRRYRHVA